MGKPPRRIFLQPSDIFTSPPVYIRRRRTDDPIDSKLLEVVNHPSKSPHHGSQPRATSGSPRDAVRRSAPFPSRLISGRTRRPRASRITSLEPQVSSLARWKGPRPRQPSSSPSTPQTLRGDVFFKPTPRPNGSSQSDLDNGFEFVFNNSTGSRPHHFRFCHDAPSRRSRSVDQKSQAVRGGILAEITGNRGPSSVALRCLTTGDAVFLTQDP